MARNVETYSILVDMRNDLMQCYREVAPNCLSQQMAWKKTVLHPAKEFYVTGKQAYQRINYYVKGRPEEIENLRYPRNLCYLDLLNVVMDLAKKPENQGKTLRALCFMAVKMPAPRFYITFRYMNDIFSKVVHGGFDSEGRTKRSKYFRSGEGKVKS